MVTLPELVYECVAAVEGGTFTDESKFPFDFVQSLIHKGRATLLRNAQSGLNPDFRQKKIHDNVLQPYTPTLDTNIQLTSAEKIATGVKNLIRFEIPEVVDMAQWMDGIAYVGSPSGLNPFKRLGTGGMKSVYAQHSITNPNNRGDITWDYVNTTQGDKWLELYNNPQIANILVMAVFAYPTDVPTYRAETDAYPVSEDMVNQIKAIVVPQLASMAAVPADIIPDSQDQANLSPTVTPMFSTPRRRRK